MVDLEYNYRSKPHTKSGQMLVASTRPFSTVCKGDYTMPHSITSTKICAKCGESKPSTVDFFTSNRSTRDGLSKWCLNCQKEYRAARENRDADLLQKYEADRRGRYLNLSVDERIAKAREFWAKSEAERLAESMPWKSIVQRGNSRRRQERVRAADGEHTRTDVEAQYQAQKGKCYYCGIQVGDTYHVDHVVPLARGGSNGPENIVIACGPCNVSKGAKLPHEWAKGGRLL